MPLRVRRGLGQLESIKSFDVSTTDMQRFERALNEPGLHAASELQPERIRGGIGRELSTIGELENPTVSTQSIGGAFIESIQDIKSTWMPGPNALRSNSIRSLAAQ